MDNICESPGCAEIRSIGSTFCEDHLLQMQLESRRPRPAGTLADLIKKAKQKGHILSTNSYNRRTS